MHGEDEKCIQNSEGKRPLRRPLGIDGKIILKWILGNIGWRVWTEFIWLW
jgi:hypothetical protein